MDTQGYVYTADSQSLATIKSTSPGVTVSNGIAIANQGVFTFANTLVIVTPGS